jgi:hypothetical protein
MTLKTGKRLMTENEYMVGMLHQIDAKLDELLEKRPRYIKRFISHGKKHSPTSLKDTQVPGRY